MGNAVNDDLHGLDGFQFCSCEECVDFIHLQEEVADRVVEMSLFNNYLQPLD